MNSRLVSITLVMLVSLAGCGSEPTLKPLPQGAVVLAFGDSLTYGTGTSLGDSYPAVLSRLTGLNVINAGIPGEISAKGLQRLPGLLEEHDPELLILIHGGNDMLRRMSYRATAENLRLMIELARQKDIDVVMLGVPKPGLVLSSADFYAEVAEELDVPFDEDAISDILQYPSNKSDAVHPNQGGYRMLAESIRKLLADNGAIAG